MNLRDSRERIFAVLCLAALAAGFCFVKISDYDFWWHLNLGRSVIETGTVSSPDRFSYTFFGQPQFSGEWLSDLVLYSAFASGDFFGVALLLTLVILATLYFTSRTLLSLGEGTSRTGFIAIILTLALILLSIRFRLFIRPAIFSYLFFSIFLFSLYHYIKHRQTRLLLILPLIEVLWANMSKGAFFGPGLAFLLAVSEWLRGRRSAAPWLLTAALFMASLLNPEHITPYVNLVDFALQGSSIAVVGEHQPLSTALLWGYGLKYTYGYQLVVLLSIIHLAFRRGWKNPFDLLLFIVFFIPSLFMVRMVDFFTIACAPLAFRTIEAACSALRGVLAGVLLRPVTVAFGLLGLLAVTVPGNGTYEFGTGPKAKHIPVGALAFLDQQGIGGPLFNSYPYGGYIAWQSPARKVFIDGRINQLYPPSFHEEYFAMLESPEAWGKAEERWGFTSAVLEYDLMTTGRHYPHHLNGNPDWALVYWDNVSTVFLKRTPENLETIRRFAYRVAKPYFNQFDYINHSTKGADPNKVRQDIEHDIALNPSNQEPRLLKAFFLFLNNYQDRFNGEILNELEQTLLLEPDLAIEHSAKAVVLFKDRRFEEAEREARLALSLNAEDEGASYVIQKLSSMTAN